MEKEKEARKIKIDKEKTIFVICLLITIFVLVKIFYLVLYNFKAKEVFHDKPVCETYKSLYADELNKGAVADLQPIIHQAEGEECVKVKEVDSKKKKEDKSIKPKEVKEDKAYNALTIHEVEK